MILNKSSNSTKHNPLETNYDDALRRILVWTGAGNFPLIIAEVRNPEGHI